MTKEACFVVGGRYKNLKGSYKILEIEGQKMKVRYDNELAEQILDIQTQKRIIENMERGEVKFSNEKKGNMTIKTFVSALRASDSNFYESAGNYEHRVHIHYRNTPKLSIQSKSGRQVDYNTCHVVFAHLCEHTQTGELFWFERATNSQHVRGHKCIAHIYNNLLSSAAIKIQGRLAKKILDFEFQSVVDYLAQLNKREIKREDLD